MIERNITVLGIESSCDDTSAAVVRNGTMISNVIANQDVHQRYGGVVPELASRAHQQNVIPVVDAALRSAHTSPEAIDAVAFTRGPGLLGSLLVGISFAKGFSLARNIPLVEVNHLQGHILSLFLHDAAAKDAGTFAAPEFPFLCLLVSGGHTQIALVRDYFDMKVLGRTIDDAAGEAFDKCGKVMGLPYPAGPHIDRLAKEGDASRFAFARPRIPGLDFSFSGLKTSFLYLVRDELALSPNFLADNQTDLCASLQHTIVEILMGKLKRAVKETGVTRIGIAGGVAANSGLRDTLEAEGQRRGWTVYLPERRYTTDNAAMIAITGYYRFLRGEIAGLDTTPLARMEV